MLKQIRSLAKSTAIYSLGNISSKVVGFLLLPLFTNEAYLTVQAYGALGLFEALLQLFTTLFGLGLYNGLFRFFYENTEKQGALIFTTILITLVLGGAGFLIGIIGESFFLPLIFDNIEFVTSYRWMLIAASTQLINVIPITLMRLKNDALLFTKFSIFRLLITLILTIVLLVSFQKGLESIFIAQAVSQIVLIIIVIPYIYKIIEFKFDSRVTTTMFSYSIPIMLSSLVGILIQFADRFIINSFEGLTEVGVYTLAVKLSNFIKVFVISTFSLSLTPVLFKKINDPDNKRFYSKSLTYYGYIILLVIIFVSIFSFEIIDTFTGADAYLDAYLVIPVLSISLYFVALKSVGFMGMHISNKMWFLTLLTAITLFLNLTLNILLIPKFGSMGAALASLISQIVFFYSGYLISQKLYPIPFEWMKIIFMPLLASILILIGIQLNSILIWIRVPMKLVVLTLFPIILYFFNFYEPIEISRLKGLFKKWKNPSDLISNLKNFFS